MKFRKRPVVVDAVRYDGTPESLIAIQEMGMDPVRESYVPDPLADNPFEPYLLIDTLEGQMRASMGDWIIKGVNGEFYPCKPDVFAKTYELITDPHDAEDMAAKAVKLSTIQKRNNLNAVYREGNSGPGGAYHNYSVEWESGNVACTLLRVLFQRGPRKEPDSRHGVLDTDLLEIVRDRLTEFQKGEYDTRENACALTHIEEALLWMNKRSEDRAERGVLGTTKQ